MPNTPATSLLRELRDEVQSNTPRGRRIVGVDGVDGAGKTTFADAAWADVFAEDGVVVFRASLDDFHRPRVERYVRGRHSPEGFYLDSYDYSAFRRVLVDPFRTGEGLGFQLAAFDVRRDVPRPAHWVSGPRDALLLVDGIFTHRRELVGIWNYSVWLDVSPEVAFARMAVRDGCNPDPQAPSNARYAQGQQLYLREVRPRRAASAIVDNTDPQHPKRVFEDFC